MVDIIPNTKELMKASVYKFLFSNTPIYGDLRKEERILDCDGQKLS